jgi:anti-sigma B factor antagonist
MELSLQTRTVADRTVLEVGGEIDVYTAPRLKERLLELVADGTRQIIVDLEAVEFLDSTGLGVLVGGLRRVRAEGGHLALVCTQERILKIFRITGLAGFFDIHPSIDAAMVSSPDGSQPDVDDLRSSAGSGPVTGSAPMEGADSVPEVGPGHAGDSDDGTAGTSAPPAPGS